MLRILSDLHILDARSQVRELAQLEPLLAGVETLVLNGDTCELRRDVSPAQLEELKRFFATRVPEVIYLTGNHDPDISTMHEAFAADGRVWITHGDVCLPGLTPWSRHAAEIRRAIAAELSARPGQNWDDLAVRFRIARTVAREEEHVPDLQARNWRSHLAWAWRTFFPPTQVVAMLRAWRDLPRLTRTLAMAQRPAAQVVVTGHVHLPGVWTAGTAPTVINTGSFFRPLGGNLVDVLGDSVRVCRIDFDGRRFKCGRVLSEIRLRPALR